MLSFESPEKMTLEERTREVAALLARGYLRLEKRHAFSRKLEPAMAAEIYEKSLEALPAAILDVP